ncbi:MAG TPA: 6-phosphogluconolactonase, partial [Anaerolineales bacterium]|nr:6-phosphogluconolactonase [Anaerolineales bacterium]
MKREIRVFSDSETLSRAAATIFSEQAAAAIAKRGRILVALNGGSTPARIFQMLAADYREQ